MYRESGYEQIWLELRNNQNTTLERIEKHLGEIAAALNNIGPVARSTFEELRGLQEPTH